MSTIVPLYKTTKPILRIPTRHHGVISFRAGKFATIDESLQAYFDEVLLKDRALRIYVDPDEPSIDLETRFSEVQLRQEELSNVVEAFESQKLPESTGPGGATGFKIGTNSANTSLTVAQQLAAQIKASKEAKAAAEEAANKG